MTGRELIIYILENGLENEQVFDDGRLLGFMNIQEAALKFNVGIACIEYWFNAGVLDGFKIGENVYIPINVELNLRG